MIHPTADVQSPNIGKETQIWQYCVVLPRAVIGDKCNINFNVFIENEVVIGDNVTIKSGVQLWDGITLEDNVFVGPNVTFTNDLYPRSKQNTVPLVHTLVQYGATVGANATVLAGVKIGKCSMIGAGSVVTKNIGDFELWVGNPAKHVGYVSEYGDPLTLDLISKRTGEEYQWENGAIVEKSGTKVAEKYVLKADGIKMRMIEIEDAEFVLSLRTDKRLGKFLSYTPPELTAQIKWIENYKKREADKKEFYFIYEDSDNKTWGTIRIYHLTKKGFTIGSWICNPGDKNKIAIKAWMLGVQFGFNTLNKEYCLLDVRKKNLSVMYYINLFQPEKIKDDELDNYFKLNKESFYNNRGRVINLLKLNL